MTTDTIRSTQVRDDWHTIRRALQEARRTVAGLADDAFTIVEQGDLAKEDLYAVKDLLDEAIQRLILSQGKVALNEIYTNDYKKRFDQVDSDLCRLEAWFHSIAAEVQPC